jgi:hypothetical protein
MAVWIKNIFAHTFIVETFEICDLLINKSICNLNNGMHKRYNWSINIDLFLIKIIFRHFNQALYSNCV